jgi:ABC-2 type transport system ATP-binding protein
MGNIIEIRALTKKFATLTAVNKINLTIREREIFGFLGPNGAGKTTTIGMLTTLIKPTSGSAKIAGHDIISEGDEVRSVIGVVPQSFSLFPELTAAENLSYIGKLYGMSNSAIEKRSDYLLKSVSLYGQRSRIAGNFSGGMKQRLSLAASLISDPKILFMDEPTTGLDPQSRIAMRELTKELNKQGITIIYTTHDMEEADKICDRITIMDKGIIIADGTGAQLKGMLSKVHVIEIEIESPSKNIAAELNKLNYVLSANQSERHINITVKSTGGVFFKLADVLRKKKQKVREIRLKEPSLEDVFIHLTKKGLRE